MNKEALENRKKELEVALANHDQSLNQTMANKNALLGAMAEVTHWLNQVAPESVQHNGDILSEGPGVLDSEPLNGVA